MTVAGPDDLLALELTTLALDIADGVATVTLDRPDVHNAFDTTMTDELAAVWRALRTASEVRAVVVTGRGDKAFCTGIDRSDVEFGFDPLTYEDPGRLIGPKSQELWKPVIAAVNGMATPDATSGWRAAVSSETAPPSDCPTRVTRGSASVSSTPSSVSEKACAS